MRRARHRVRHGLLLKGLARHLKASARVFLQLTERLVSQKIQGLAPITDGLTNSKVVDRARGKGLVQSVLARQGFYFREEVAVRHRGSTSV